MPSASALLLHKVKDYDAWKTAFDAGEQARKDAGIVAHSISRDQGNPKLIGVWVATEDLSKVESFIASADLKKTMKDAGVIGKPTAVYMKHADMSAPTEGAQPK